MGNSVKMKDITIFDLVQYPDQNFTNQEIRQLSLHCALRLIEKELIRSRNNISFAKEVGKMNREVIQGEDNITLADEMSRLKDYTKTIEKLIKMQ